MTRHGLLLLGLLMCVSGCALPSAPFDNHFAAYGGSWQRGDPVSGRVGSVFDPTGETVLRPPDAVEPQEQEQPGDADRSILRPAEREPSRGDDAPPEWESLLD